ncbi:hypothetical protein ACFVXQ_29075, partial [Kitasatospora sp. NPDC058263]
NREAPWRELHRRLAGGTPPNTDRTVVPLPTRSGTQPRPEPVGTGWAELHVHSSYSFLDGPSDPAPAPGSHPS